MAGVRIPQDSPQQRLFAAAPRRVTHTHPGFQQLILMTAAHSPLKGNGLGFLAYFLFSCSDANVKALGGHLPVFEIGFFSTLFAALVLLFLKPRDERWRDAIHMHRPRLVALR